jgi:hypothetical protein
MIFLRAPLRLLLASLFLAAPALAADLVVKGGRYVDYTVTAVEEEGIRIAFRDGAGFVPFSIMLPEDQLRFGWTPEKAAAFRAEEERRRQVAAEAIRSAEERQAAWEYEVRREQRERVERARAELELLAREREEARRAQEPPVRVTYTGPAPETARPAHETNSAAPKRKYDGATEEELLQQVRKDIRGNPVFLFCLALVALLYFVPTALAIDKRNFLTVFIVNLLLGWTFVFWIVAIVMAIQGTPNHPRFPMPPPPYPYPRP